MVFVSPRLLALVQADEVLRGSPTYAEVVEKLADVFQLDVIRSLANLRQFPSESEEPCTSPTLCAAGHSRYGP